MTSPSSSLGALFVEVRPGTSRFEPELTSATVAAGNKAADKAGPGMGRKLAGHIGTAIAAGTGILAVGLAKGISGAVDKASDLNETVSKTQQVFGKAGKGIIDWSKTTDKSLGQSQQATLDAAATFAIYGKAAGKTGKANVDFSKNLVKLAGDMASFSNTSPEEAIDAIGAAMRGESDPIEKYGILMNDTTLKNEALRKGIIKTTKGSLTPQQRVLATQAVLFEQLGKKGSGAIGDFQRTSAGLANQNRIAQASLTNLGATIGTAFLPIVTRLVTTFNAKVIPALQTTWRDHGPQIIAFASNAADRFQKFASSLDRAKIDGWVNQAKGALAAAQPVIKSFFDNFKQGGGQGVSDTVRVTGVAMHFLADNADTLAKALPAVITLFVAYKTAQLAANVVSTADPFIKIASAVATSRLAKANRELAGALKDATITQVVQNAATGTAAVEENVVTTAKSRGVVATIASRVATIASTAATWLASAATTAFGVAVRFATGPIGIIITVIAAAAAGIIYLYKHNETARKIIDGAWHGIQVAIHAVASWFTGTIMPSLRQALDQGKAFFSGFGSVVSKVFRAYAAVIRTEIAIGMAIFRGLWTFVTQTLPNGFRSGVGAITSAWAKVKEAAAKPVRFVINTVFAGIGGVFNHIADFLHLPSNVRFPAIRAAFSRGGRFDGQLPGPTPPRGTDNMLGYGPRGDPVALAGGEYIVNPEASQRNLAVLEAMNAGRSFALGGLLDFLKNPVSYVKGKVSGFTNRIASVAGNGPLGGMLSGMASSVVTGTINKVKSFVGGILGGRTKGGGPFGPWPVSPAAQRGDSGIWRRVVALIQATGPLSGSFGNAYRPGDPLWHGSGRAVDWMGFNQDALASYLASLGPLELIHRSARRDYAYTRGVNKGSFNNALMEAHRNHVHIAFNKGGQFKRFDGGGLWPSGTVGVNTSGRTEHVTTGKTMDDQVALSAAMLDALRRLGPEIAATVVRALGSADTALGMQFNRYMRAAT